MTDWAQTCATILTSPTAREPDLEQCRALMHSTQGDFGWPGAFALAVVALAAAWSIPRTIKALND